MADIDFIVAAATVIIAIGAVVAIFIVRSKNYEQTKLDAQALAPKKDLEILKTPGVIGFRVSGKLFQQISDWEYVLDKLVFKEQLATGSFRGKCPVDESSLELMKQVEKEGGILPYYGVGGSRGVCEYYFSPTSDGFTVRVEHDVTEEFLNINISHEEIGGFVDREALPKLKHSSIPYLINTKLPEAWSKTPDNEIIFRIAGKEYQSLVEWENWVEAQAFSSRYVYRFGLVSLGPGYTVKIEDTETGTTIDVSDYWSW
jgi:hypothetical protein